jgi:CRP/FNR family transcriptional regulator, cyclic AMP receptor protein
MQGMNIRMMELLEPLPIFSGLNPAAVAIISRCRPVEVQAGRSLLAQEEVGSRMYVIVAGCVDIQGYYSSGEPIYLAQRGAGELIGELSLIDGKPHVADVVAASQCVLLPLDRAQFRDLVAADPRFALNVMTCLAGKLRQAAARPERYRSRRAEVRVARALLEQTEAELRIRTTSRPPEDITLRVSQEVLATRTGMARPSVAKAIARLRQLGALKPEDKGTRHITVVNRNRLRRAAEG